MSVGQDKEHAMAVYVWAERRRVFSGKCGQRKVLDACFGEGDMVVTCGVNHIYFWSKEGETTVRWAPPRPAQGPPNHTTPHHIHIHQPTPHHPLTTYHPPPHRPPGAPFGRLGPHR